MNGSRSWERRGRGRRARARRWRRPGAWGRGRGGRAGRRPAAPPRPPAGAAAAGRAAGAGAAGLATHWGRKVLEVRPPVAMDKGRGIRWLLRDADVDAAVYVGDDRTDLDAFAGLRDAVAAGRLSTALCVGVRSEETPADLEAQADLLVDGPRGVRELLRALLG